MPLIQVISLSINRHRLPTTQWWLKLRPLLRILAKHDSTYEEEGINVAAIAEETETE